MASICIKQERYSSHILFPIRDTKPSICLSNYQSRKHRIDQTNYFNKKKREKRKIKTEFVNNSIAKTTMMSRSSEWDRQLAKDYLLLLKTYRGEANP